MESPGNAKVCVLPQICMQSATKVGYISEQSAYHHGEAGLLDMGHWSTGDLMLTARARKNKHLVVEICLGDIGDYTTQLCGDSSKPL